MGVVKGPALHSENDHISCLFFSENDRKLYVRGPDPRTVRVALLHQLITKHGDFVWLPLTHTWPFL